MHSPRCQDCRHHSTGPLSGMGYCDAMGPRVFAHGLRLLAHAQCGTGGRWFEQDQRAPLRATEDAQHA